MKVFKACLLVMRFHTLSIVINIGIFLILLLVISLVLADDFDMDFTAVRPNFTIINRDVESPLVDGLTTYLSERGNKVELEDNRMALQDATFFSATDLIVFIPHGFHKSFILDNPMTLEIVKATHTARGFLAEAMVEQYLNLARVYMAAGGDKSEENIVSAVLYDLSLESSVEKVQFGINVPVDQSFLWYARMLNYTFLIITFLCVSVITMVFRRPDVRKRNLCAPITSRSFSAQQILAGSTLNVLIWVLLTALGFLLYGSNLEGVDSRVIALMLLNSFLCMIYASALAALASNFVTSSNSQNAIANVMTLALCFLGGVFVPLELLGDGILAISRFLPTYWNVTALERISGLTSFEASALTPVWQAMVIQIAFAAAFFSITLVITKYLNQSERFFGSVKTELEA